MERYSEYKDSGVEWLGEIPRHWGLIKSKYLWKESFNISEQGNEELLSVSQYDGIIPAKGDTRSEALDGYKIVKKDDLVINIMLAWMGGLGISSYNGIVSPAYCVYKLNHNYNPRFFHYLYKTPLYLSEFAKHSTGVIPSRWRMYTDDFGQVLSLIPPIEEQNAIVAYLDKVTSKIDAAIAQQKKMIELLNERKQIIINNAVTKGLDPTAKMKPSGIPWLGNIPAHWEIIKAKYIWKEYIEKAINENEPLLSVSQYNGVSINGSGSRSESLVGYKVVHNNVLVINIMLAWMGGFGVSNIEGIVSPAYCTYKCCLQKTIPQYLGHLYKSNIYLAEFARKSTGVIPSRWRMYTDDFGQVYTLVPPIDEQHAIIDYINEKNSGVNPYIENCNKQIALLQERKQIIINNTVTGKVKIV